MAAPRLQRYDVVIIGGAMHGASLAWWLSRTEAFGGTVLVIERDPTYTFASTSHTNSCIRQQFSNEANIRVSQFGASFIRNFRSFMGDDPDVPDLTLQSFGYLYLADTQEFAHSLRQAQAVQVALGAATRHMTRDEIAAAYPFYQLDDIVAGNHNLVDEGYFDGGTMFDWFRRKARQNGVEFAHGDVTGITRGKTGVDGVTLADGTSVSCGTLVNATGPRAAATAAMAGIDIPVVPRKRFTFVFDAARPLEQDLPLTIDPSGVHVRSDGRYYMAGCGPDEDLDVAYDDFAADHAIWQDKVWPAVATRIPQFDTVKLVNEWVGHYAYNTLDQNALLGPVEGCPNFIFVNGFSGHGLQQAPAVGRGIAELITYGEYRAIDLSAFDVNRALRGERFLEKAVI
ncbi:FAD-binding oxidoreductase [Sulfitobacter sp. HNIBRBA3233]|uniref:NAD(P)/FAD-dependent oxidoreductase n=1 Tax=Sulfitobacter marinivivus TaxID=3158558 RepID=UPI0032E03CD3